jgi:hypothetical protein
VPSLNRHSQGLESRVSGRVLDLLPGELGLVHGYVDEALDLTATLKTQLRKLTPAEFEQVLHPVFQEDELTLILVGAVLGLAVGYGQLVWDQKERAKLAAGEEEAAADDPTKPDAMPGVSGVVSWYDAGQRLA